MWLQDVFVGLNLSGVLLLTFIALLMLDLLKNRNPPNYPPGPLALPLVGSVFNVDPRQPHIYLTKVGSFLPLPQCTAPIGPGGKPAEHTALRLKVVPREIADFVQCDNNS